jgi:hypothetical protein
MATVEQLIVEAGKIRDKYRQTHDSETRARLSARYKEIDLELTELRTKLPIPEPKTKAKKKSNVISDKVASSDALAAELLNLCQSLTSDGRINNEEIRQLQQWLQDTGDSEVPAVAFLRDIVELVCKDGAITDEQRKQLYCAIEAVLPPDFRKFAKQRRRAVEALQKDEDRKRRQVEKEEERYRRKAQRELERAIQYASSPVHHADFMVAGVHYEGRDAVIRRYVEEDMNVYLVRERNNKHSVFATAIVLGNGLQIGYVPEDEVDLIAPRLDDGHPYKAYVKIVLTGGRIPIPVIVVDVYRPDAPVEGLVWERDNPRVKKKGLLGF